jgi:hypothetical protein
MAFPLRLSYSKLQFSLIIPSKSICVPYALNSFNSRFNFFKFEFVEIYFFIVGPIDDLMKFLPISKLVKFIALFKIYYAP